MHRLSRFVLVGGIGFLVDAGVLALLLTATPLGPLAARIVSIGVALTATWMLNRTVTFRPSGRGLAREGLRYGGVGVATSLVNYLAYSAILLAVPGTPPLAALAVASLAAMALSFLGYVRLVFDR
jgi:putative flippase GtrA